MLIELELRKFVLDNSGVKALTQHMMPEPLDLQNAAVPALTYKWISAPPEYTLAGPVNYHHPRIQLRAYAHKLVDAVALSRAVKKAINGFKGEFVPGGNIVQFVEIADDRRTGFEPETRCHTCDTDYILHHQEKE